jgi:uncharacterized protein (DUF305 family)
MTISQRRRLSVLMAAATASISCSSAHPGTVQTSPSSGPQAAGGDHGERAAIAQAKADSVRHPYTEADVHFMSGMISHHAQAIVMAGWAPTHDASPSVRTLAARIINAQQDEIATMQTWLRDRQQPVPAADAKGTTMMMNGVERPMLMPGMLTDAQMKELDQARGAEFDRLFLTYMIQHHRGAVSMVQDLFGTYGAGQDEVVFKFASDVNVDQSTEIARMERMLALLSLENRAQ